MALGKGAQQGAHGHPEGPDSLTDVPPIGGRYQLQRQLGRGGAAAVFEARDVVSGETVALKQLLPSKRRRGSTLERLFELEYHTLCQLDHPSIVRVHEYGQDERGAFYTMEMLSGSELGELAPMPWPRVCEILMQVCAALSVVHSRRLVHRDVTPRNIHCPPRGRAKLIDFGAMAAVGPCSHAVGTAPCLAPEVFGLQTIDARTDLYSLGATAYYVLTGRHAYPARTVDNLPVVWSKRAPPPSRFAPDVPAQLDELVMSLLSLEPMPRPRSAVEVMQRLVAIAGLPPDAQVAAAHYLATPLLVGRQEVLELARDRLEEAKRGHGGVLLLTGPAGSGRSRCLDACVLAAKLDGARVLRAGRGAGARPWGTARSLVSQLRALFADGWPVDSPWSAALDRHFPAPGQSMPTSVSDPPEASQRAEVLQSLSQALLSLAAEHRLAIAVDDMEAMDEPSVALLALLAMQARQRGLLMVVTTDPDAGAAAREACQVILRGATHVPVEPLSAAQTRAMLASVVGEVPHLDLLSDKLHEAGCGIPRRIMGLTQHLIDTRRITLRSGAFVLPESLRLEELPVDETAAHRLRAAHLTTGARELATRLALCPKGGLSLPLAEQLSLPASRADHMRAMEELHGAGLLRVQAGVCTLLDRAIRAALVDDLSASDVKRHCLRLARVFAGEGSDFSRVVDYLVRADELEQALDMLLASLSSTGLVEDVGERLAERLSAQPADWFATCDRLLSHCQRTGRPRRDAHRIRAYLFSIALLLDQPVDGHVHAVLGQLAQDSGLDLYASLAGQVPDGERLARTLALAEERFRRADARDRVTPPQEAIPLLARTTSQALALLSPAGDADALAALPDISPLAPLSGALSLMNQNVHFVTLNVKGFEDEAREGYLAMATCLEQPGGVGLDSHAERYIRLSLLFGAAVADVVRERRGSLEIADVLEQDPLFVGHAWTLRRYYALVTGDPDAAEQARAELELRRIREAPRTLLSGRVLWLSALCHARRDDLTGVQESLAALEPFAERNAAWVPWLQLMRAVYERIRGDLGAARQEIDRASALVEVGRHRAWVWIAAERARIALASGDAAGARELAAQDLARAQEVGLGWTTALVRLLLGLAELSLGDGERATDQVQAAMTALEAGGTGGVLLGEAYEARARIAAAEDDLATFTHYAKRAAECYRPEQNATLAARHQRLMGLAPKPPAAAQDGMPQTLFEGCRDASDRARRALELLMIAGGASKGYLYLMGDGGPNMVATSPQLEASAQTDAFVRTFVQRELDAQSSATVSGGSFSATVIPVTALEDRHGEAYTALALMHCTGDQFWLTGAVLLNKPDPSDRLTPNPALHRLSQALHDIGDARALALD